MFIGVFFILLILSSATQSLHLRTTNANNVNSLTVPDEYSTIQNAINTANDGDTIRVKKGTYNGALEVNKSVSLVGEDASTTIINGQSETQYLFPSGRPTISIYAPNVVLSGFNITNCDVAISIENSGIHLTGNNIDNNMKGLSGGGSNTVVSGNNITNNLGGISFAGQDSIFSNNLFYNNYNALGISSCKNISLYNNKIINNGAGLALSSASNLIVSNNKIVGNLVMYGNHGYNIPSEGYGIFLTSNCNNTLIYSNSIEGNTEGIAINDIHLIQGVQGLGNLIYENNLFDNKQNANLTDFGGISQIYSWDNETVGNYWGDYNEKYPNAIQEDALGIWDTPYTINNNNTDRYPLIFPVNITIESPSTIGISGSSQITLLTIGIVTLFAIILFIAVAVIIRTKKT